MSFGLSSVVGQAARGASRRSTHAQRRGVRGARDLPHVHSDTSPLTAAASDVSRPSRAHSANDVEQRRPTGGTPMCISSPKPAARRDVLVQLNTAVCAP